MEQLTLTIGDQPIVTTLDDLLALALALGARAVPGWLPAEEAVACGTSPSPPSLVAATQSAIQDGGDPLGDAYCRILTAEERRPRGATYTPQPIIDAMLAWAAAEGQPDRVIDPGAGSARFLVAAGRRFPDAELIAVELDQSAAILARGHLAAAGLAGRATVIVADYREARLPAIGGRTLFLGNPPYVRHHLLGQRWKAWLTERAGALGYRASQLAGLHAHFFLATALYARPGDVGAFITAAEWLDVNYGRLIRELLTGLLGVKNIQIIEPSAEPFPGTATTAVITGFEVGAHPAQIGVRRVASIDALGSLTPERRIPRQQLEQADRWTPLTRATRTHREGFVELGELCRVHRGQVTGANRVWVIDRDVWRLPEAVLVPSVTKARELFAAGDVLDDVSRLRRVIDLPVDLDLFDAAERMRIERFLDYARAHGADSGYIARNRKAWWSVGLRQPAPILATYMARRPPVFVRNLVGARHINIAHGLYPRDSLTEQQLRGLAAFLSRATSVVDGRTYAGGLTKFEPREMERLLVPHPDLLAERTFLELPR